MRFINNLSIKKKILLGIGLSFILAMIFLLLILIYQFNDLLAENQDLIEEELMERKFDKYESLVKTRAKVLAEINQIILAERAVYGDEIREIDIRTMISKVNRESDLEENYFFIYDLEGNTISLPPEPELEGRNRIDLVVEGRYLLKEMIEIIENEGGGRIKYPYTNPNTDLVEKKYGYLERIETTDYFVGSGGYQSDYYSIVDSLVLKISEIRDQTIYLLLIIFFLIILIITAIIFDISNYINSQLEKIITAFKKVEKGKLDFKIEFKNKDEFSSLAAGFNKMIDKINKLTYNDPITGLPNFNFLENNLSEDLAAANHNDKEKIYLFTVNTENLNLVNSNYGYQKGNEILKEVYKRLSKNLAYDFIIARKNDQFIFYFNTEKGKNEIKDFAKEIIINLAAPYEIDSNLVYLKTNIGIADNDGINSCHELIRKSRLALHFINNNNKLKFFEPKMLGQLSGRFNLESKLRQAIENKEFQLYYQPQLKIADNKVVGVEALIRWLDPEEGIISPGKFIPLAEDTGMILELGDWILNEALNQLKLWHDTGHSEIIMAVNIAPQQFEQDNFVDKVKQLLSKYQLKAKYLELEITERTVIKNIDYTVKVLKELKKLGVKISIDDFGTGYSSLEYLNRFALDKLKIDKSFIHGRNNSNIVKTIIMMGSNLGLEVVAEGVETEKELKFLQRNNCSYYQGYFYAKAEEAFVVEKYFNKQGRRKYENRNKKI